MVKNDILHLSARQCLSQDLEVKIIFNQHDLRLSDGCVSAGSVFPSACRVMLSDSEGTQAGSLA